jgi:hypothetical protein
MEYSKQLRELLRVMSTVESILQNEQKPAMEKMEMNSTLRMQSLFLLLATYLPQVFEKNPVRISQAFTMQRQGPCRRHA